MKQIFIITLMLFASPVWAQQLMISPQMLFSEGANTLQPLVVDPTPGGVGLCGFCPGLMGGFNWIEIENTKGNMEDARGLLVSAITVDKDKKKIIDDPDCFWDSSNPEIVSVASVERGNKRLFALLPRKEGRTTLTVKMEGQAVQLCMVVSKEKGSLRYLVKNPSNEDRALADKQQPEESNSKSHYEDAPFKNLERKGWGLNNGDKAKYFCAERERLGDDFKKELLNYIGKDLERHYWCASFLWSDSYLNGNEAMPELALLIYEQGISLCLEDPEDEDRKGMLVSMSVNAAILSKTLGLTEQAQRHRSTAESLVASDDNLKYSWPWMGKDEKTIFESIEWQKK